MHYLIFWHTLNQLISVLLNYYVAMPGSSDLRATKTAQDYENKHVINNTISSHASIINV